MARNTPEMLQFYAYSVFLLLAWNTAAEYRPLIRCSFESACALRQDQGDDFDWAEGRGRLQEPALFAPSADHTFGDASGVYLYTQSDATRAGQSAKLISDELTVTTNATALIDFVYHMYDEEGVDRLGSLLVYVNGVLMWNRSGNQGPTWMRALFNATCNSTSMQVTFEGILGGMHSDIGLDDVSIGVYEAPLPDPTVEVTPDVTPTKFKDAWRTTACALLALVGILGVCVAVAVVYICRLRKRLGDTRIKGACVSAPSLPQGNTDIEPSGYLPLNACVAKTTDNPYLQATVSQPPAVNTAPAGRPEHMFLRSRKLSWNDEQCMDEGVYEYVCTD